MGIVQALRYVGLSVGPLICESTSIFFVIIIKSVVIILHLRSVDPWKLYVCVKYYIVHMYSMPYYTYGSAANFLFLEPTALIYIKRPAL